LDLRARLHQAEFRTFTLIDPKLKNPQTEQWRTAFRVFDLLL
jgi:hypothetical protein